ncbi:hypothetical protein CHARACLAT_024713 [Characodon lateralis]|uniref:Mediator of RNA polymerase II transcription subunit 24 n=1 Tax=Characodon lateralis TaxID=208331 RepID=A0ABU7EDC0_9TELE|nr:hypothetical protein [Characodon lateralis]
MDSRLRNKDRKKDKKDDKTVASKQVVAKANTSRGETDTAALNVNLNLGQSEDGQSMGVLSSVLGEICQLNKTLSEKIDTNLAQFQTSINGVKIALDKVLTRVTEAENRISNTEDAVGDRSMSSSLSPSQLHTVNMRDPLNRVLANLFLLFSSILGSKTAGPHTQFVQSFIEECVECLEQGSRGSILQFMPFTMVSYKLGGEGAWKISQKETDG